MKPHRLSPREALAVANAFATYLLVVIPTARRELRRWEQRARQIPDPTLRAHALRKLADEGLNPEAAAVFSLIAPRRRTAAVIKLTVAFQALYDYLDAVGEQPVPAPLDNNRQLHQALVDAVDPSTSGRRDYYSHHPQRDDGGYIHTLITTCHATLSAMPSHLDVAPVLIAATRRCAEGQARTNVAATLGVRQLERWVATDLEDPDYRWWEVAAGAAASLSVLAILAASADPRTSPHDARRIDAAYQPAICGLTTLLDSLIDYAHDGDLAEHRYLAYYPTRAEMQERVTTIAKRSITQARQLPHGPRHAVLVAGIAAFYLSAPQATTPFARPSAERVIATLEPIVTIPLRVMRIRRRARSR